MRFLLIALAATCFGLDALGWRPIPVNFTAAGFCLLTVALLIL